VGQSRASFAFAKPSDIRAVMQMAKEKHDTPNLDQKTNTLDPQRTASPARGLNDEDDKLMAVVTKANQFNSKRQSVVSQMAESFVHLDLHDAESNGAPNTGGRPAPMTRQVEASNSGTFRRMGSIRALNGGTGPSNRVPEMRRRAAPQDLMFAEEEEGANDKSGGDLGSSCNDSKEFSLSNLKFGDIPKIKKGDDVAKDAKEHHKQLQKEVVAQRRQQNDEKLAEAKNSFQQGHDLCWQENDSVGALAKYRVALYVRESLLGKYHEDTGRTYYWIGRSLIKLRDFEEALVAFSRALRIFERTLFSKHKYNKWASGSIDTCFQEMGVNDAARDEYKTHLNASIQYERSGDQLRKAGRFADAIVEYRNGIDTIEEYNPDAADLYCKIAMIFRTQGEFDKALEEYRMASKIYQLSLGAEHPDTVKTLSQLIEKKRMNQLSLALQEKLDLNKP
jgi:tetratricopeptide (TPR) repeat protein